MEGVHYDMDGNVIHEMEMDMEGMDPYGEEGEDDIEGRMPYNMEEDDG